jgi:hypothetical protein
VLELATGDASSGLLSTQHKVERRSPIEERCWAVADGAKLLGTCRPQCGDRGGARNASLHARCRRRPGAGYGPQHVGRRLLAPNYGNVSDSFSAMPDWTFLTSHGRALLYIARDPHIRLRDLATTLGITERSAYGIVNDLVDAGYVVKTREGRRNSYEIQRHLPLPELSSQDQAIGQVLALLTGQNGRRKGERRMGGRPTGGQWEGVDRRVSS